MSSATEVVGVSGYCVHCGKALLPSARFCQSCGSAIGTTSSTLASSKPVIAAAGTSTGDDIAELEHLAAQHPEEESYQKLLAVQLHDDAMKDWWQDPKDGRYLRLPAC